MFHYRSTNHIAFSDRNRIQNDRFIDDVMTSDFLA